MRHLGYGVLSPAFQPIVYDSSVFRFAEKLNLLCSLRYFNGKYTVYTQHRALSVSTGAAKTSLPAPGLAKHNDMEKLNKSSEACRMFWIYSRRWRHLCIYRAP
jgi:hypothetical protein